MRRTLALAALLLLTACGVRPSDVILGGPAPTATSVVPVYWVSDGRVTPVLRPDFGPGLALLATGPTPTEAEQGYTTEVPAATVFGTAGSTVTVSVDVTTLSTNAVDQIVCTAATGDVTLVGGGQTRGPLTCPVG
ncbi:MAG TPA: hypothetical protein VNO31_02495 [Umezawaea sp.]|nr:hypothetical protein [Umezawaea sp.]